MRDHHHRSIPKTVKKFFLHVLDVFACFDQGVFQAAIIWSGTKSVVALPCSSEPKSVKNLWKKDHRYMRNDHRYMRSDHRYMRLFFFVDQGVFLPKIIWSGDKIVWSGSISSDQVTKSCDQGQNHLKKRLQPDQIHLASGGSYYFGFFKYINRYCINNILCYFLLVNHFAILL